MKKIVTAQFPDEIARDIARVQSILLCHGAVKVILYGSLARGDYRPDSDIDICFEGIAAADYFRVIAECLMETDRRVSLLDFENVHGYFRQRIIEEGKIIYERK